MSHSVHPVDERLPITRLVPLAISACPRYVCGRSRGSPDHWACSEPPAGAGLLPDKRRSVRLRSRHHRAKHGFSGRRDSPTGDDGRHLRLGRSDAVDGSGARDRSAWHLRRSDRRRHIRCSRRPIHQSASTDVSAGRHRHDHPGNRHFADASGHKLGRRWLADVHQSRRWHAGRISESCLWSAHRSRCRAFRAGRYSLADQMGARLRCERGGAVGNCRRRGARRGNRVDAFRKGRNGALGRYRVAVPFWRAGIPPDPNHHDVHRHGGGHDRITRHVSGSW